MPLGAVQDGGEDVRLIDADAMYEEFVRKSSIYDATDLPDMLGNMPTIPAVPVEWLETAIGKFKAAGRRDHVEVVQSLIKAWKSEEELKGLLEEQLVCMAKKIFEEMDEKDRNAIIEKLGYVPWSDEEG